MTKTLDRISKLLNKAENAGTPEEAEAFMAKVQELASITNVDLAVARMHQAKKERVQQPEERRIQVNPMTRRTNRKHFMELAMAIANVNDVKYLISGGQYALLAVGFPEDLDVVEALLAHLAVQMATECDEALARGENKAEQVVPVTRREPIPFDERDWGGWSTSREMFFDEHPGRTLGLTEKEYEERIDSGERDSYSEWGSWRRPFPPPKFRVVPVLDDDGNIQYDRKTVSVVDGRVFRNSFYEAFVTRIRGRLWETRRAAERQMGVTDAPASSETALALRDKKAEVDKASEEQRAKVRHLGTYKSAAEDGRQHTYIGQAAGDRAAQTVPIDDRGRGVEK